MLKVTASKMLALVIAATYVTGGFALEKGWTFALTVAAGTLLPLALIWFPEFLGGLTGWGARTLVDRPTPSQLITVMGWLFLLGLPVLVFLAGKS
jgi:hypothetical protein